MNNRNKIAWEILLYLVFMGSEFRLQLRLTITNFFSQIIMNTSVEMSSFWTAFG